MKNIPVILLGCGGVGRHLLQHIVSCRSLHAKLQNGVIENDALRLEGVRLRVVGVSDSKSLLLASDVFTRELDDTFLNEVSRVKLGVNECQVFANSEATRTVIDTATRLSKSTGLVVVDCSASSETMGVLNQAVDLGCCIVLANKKASYCCNAYKCLKPTYLFFGLQDDYDKLVAHPRRIRYESTVGAGLPVIASLNRILSSGDPIRCIVACLSGTLGYVMSEVEGGKPFSQVVKDAKSLGYTEPGILIIALQ
uniref:homoserine dehydrogenase n=1 Tax=Vitis vinifera TaxID=29760 RepID=A5AJE4_VITVI|nr:hypothetical protein VITISV_041909 [Vitis vinifera]